MARGSFTSTFAGIAIASSPGGNAFLLTSQGVLKSIYAFALNAGPIQTLVQAVNRRLYGTQQAPFVNFSLAFGGSFRTYPPVLPYAPIFSIQMPDGSLYGTEHTLNGHNAFARMTLNGTLTVLHNFSAQEGIPYVLPLMASDGNFYGISGIGTSTPP